jgi:hypothetical protein
MRKVLAAMAVIAVLGIGLAGVKEGTAVKNPDVAALVKGDNEVAFDLYAQLREKDGNLILP